MATRGRESSLGKEEGAERSAEAARNALAKKDLAGSTGKKPSLTIQPGGGARQLFPWAARDGSKRSPASLDVSKSGHLPFPPPNLQFQWKQLSNVLESARGKEFTWYTATYMDRNVTATIARGADQCATGAAAAARMEVAIAIMSKLDHPNILPLIGAGRTPGGHRFMVVPSMALGTLALHADPATCMPQSSAVSSANAARSFTAPSAPARVPAFLTASARSSGVEAAVQGESTASARVRSSRGGAGSGSTGGGGSARYRSSSSQGPSSVRSAGLFASLRSSIGGGGADRRTQSRSPPRARATRRSAVSTGHQRREGDSPSNKGGLFGGLRFSFSDGGGAAALAALKEPLAAALAIARAMEYMHKYAIPGSTVIHRDLRPDHIMVQRNGTVRVAGFGRAVIRELEMRNPTAEFPLEAEVGAPRYQAPEMALGRPYNGKADVYSFGIMLWELAKGQRPFSGMRRSELWGRVVLGEQRPPLEPHWPEDLRNLLVSCWGSEPHLRPNFSEIVGILHGLHEAACSAADAPSSPSFGSLISSFFG